MIEHVYADYMDFKSPQEFPFDPAEITGYLQQLGATHPEVTLDEAEALRECYLNEFRSYHGEGHGGFVGQPDLPQRLKERLTNTSEEEAKAILALAGLFHDAVYKHVDDDGSGTRAWPAIAEMFIGGRAGVAYYKREFNAEGKAIYRTFLTGAGQEDPVTQAVARIFGVTGKGGIIHNQGGNEFDSALLAAKFLESKGASPKTIIAVTSAIAATVPFKPAKVIKAGRITDGHMGELADRVETVALTSGGTTFKPDWIDVNDIMFLSVHLANRDISPFIQVDNFGAVIDNGRRVKKEELPSLREVVRNIKQLLASAGLEASAPLLYRWIGRGDGPVPAANVPHFYIPRTAKGVPLHKDTDGYYPPLPVYHQAVSYAENNAWLSSVLFEAHQASIALVAAIAAGIEEPEAEVPGIVHSEDWSDEAIPQGGRFAELDPQEVMLYQIMMGGIGEDDVDIATPRRSPIAGVLFGVLGTQGIINLADHVRTIYADAARRGISEPFSTPDIARGYILEVQKRIGKDNMWSIFNELRKVAEGYARNASRARAIAQLAGDVGLKQLSD